ncbi:MAG TPA: hypothetical protein VFK90_00775, partial [Anaeromyxobacter sp.]|nr:hypothetical protein [Anaeromyxobacter sp.]
MIRVLAVLAAVAAAAAPERAGAPRPLACPAGTERGGAAPPEGYEEWCEAKVKDVPDARRRHGPARVYYDDGRLWVEESFTDGVRDGRFVEWHRNGARAREGAFAAGSKQGRWTIWTEDGTVAEESEWR